MCFSAWRARARVHERKEEDDLWRMQPVVEIGRWRLEANVATTAAAGAAVMVKYLQL